MGPAFAERTWTWLGGLLMPRWLYHGPYWWRAVNAWWLGWWGWAFFYSKPWRPGTLDDSGIPSDHCPVCTKELEPDGWCFECRENRVGGPERSWSDIEEG